MTANKHIESIGAARRFVKPKTEIKPLTAEALTYLTEKRGLRRDTLTAYGLGCNNRGEIVIPFADESGEVALVKRRHPQGQMLRRQRKNDDNSVSEYEVKTDCEAGGKPVLLGSQLCDPAEGPLVICFGDYDAMATAQDGVPNCVSLPFGDKGFGFIDQQWAFLEKFAEIILYPDADRYPNPEAAQRAQKKLDELATRLGRYRLRLVRDEDRYGTKDANELLLTRGTGFNRKAIENAVWYPAGIVVVADYVEEESPEGIPTGMPVIDKATGGLAGGQLIIVSGDNGSGKTTLGLNWAANFIEEDVPVFLWSGEQKVGKIRYWFERIAAGRFNLRRQIGGKTRFEYFFPLDEVKDKIRRWYRHFLFQYTEVAIDAETFFEAAELGVRRYGCGLIIIDNLMAFTGGEGDGYYQAQGDFAQSCKRFAEKWDVPVILICHNKKEDEGKNAAKLPDKNSIEGSKKITNWADFVFQMYRVPELKKFEFGNADNVLKLCKTRESGILEDVRLVIDTESNRFCQMSEAENLTKKFGWETM